MITTPASRVIERISQTCPHCHKSDIRLYSCDNPECSYRSCISCMIRHEEGVAKLKGNLEAGTRA